jgi:ligand-binding sensor domain-containing protein
MGSHHYRDQLGLGITQKLIMGADGSVWRLGNYTSSDRTVWMLANIDRTRIITQELPINFIGPMVADPQRGIWLGTDRGLLYADGTDLYLGLVKDLAACVGPSYIKEIVDDSQGTTWARSLFDGIYALPPGETQWQPAVRTYPYSPIWHRCCTNPLLDSCSPGACQHHGR